jgi:hypothetical protein
MGQAKPVSIGSSQTFRVARDRLRCFVPCVNPDYRKDSFAPGASGKPSAAALVRRDHVDTNTKCSVGNVPLCRSEPRVHVLNFWGCVSGVEPNFSDC